MLQISRRMVLLCSTLCLLPVTAWSQVGTMDGIQVTTHKFVAGRVTGEKGEPVRNARVEIATNAGTRFVSVATDSQGQFSNDFFLTFAPKEFTATFAVSKKGYPTAHAFVNYGSTGKPPAILIVLRHPPNDPTLLSADDLVLELAPRFRALGPSDGLSEKDLKTYQPAARQFLDRNRLDLAVPDLEKVAASNASCARCRLMTALAEMRWGDWVRAESRLGEAVNTFIANRQPGASEPLLAYGVWLSWQHNPEKAEYYLREAVKDAPRDALALQELGRVQCLGMNWEGGEDSLNKALAAGAGPVARMLHAEALVWTGTVKDAEAELNRYLDGRDIKKMPPRVQAIGQKIEDRKKDDTALVKLQKQAAPYTDYIHNPPSELQGIEPAGEEIKLDSILSAVGKNVANLFQKFPNTSSLEKIHQEKLDRKGKSAGSLDQKFRYLCLMPSGQWGPRTDEYRADSTGQEAFPRGLAQNFMLTAGFVAAPLVFHPAYQPGSTFRLLGRQKIKDRDAYVIAFAQEPKRSRMSGSFRVAGTSKTTFYQGVAWIDPTTYQILKLRTELLAPIPVVKLQAETTEIEFSEVHFKRLAEGFWLPAEVTVTLDWEGRVLRNRHEYSDFAVFNVDAMQKIASPKDAPPAAQEGSATPETP